MAVEWREVPVEEIKAPTENALATGPFGSSIGSRFFTTSGVPVIRGGNLSEEIATRLDDDGLVFLSAEKATEFRRSTVRKGDLIFTCWGTVNQVGLIEQRAAHQEYIISNKQMKLTPDPAKADSLFLYYLFSSPELQHRIKNQSIGSSVPGFNLGQLRAMRIQLPELDEQRRIADVLGVLDDKIELNRRMNETLEAIARAIFKDQLTASDMTQGWPVFGLDEIACFLNGLALQKYPRAEGEPGLPVVKIAQLRAGHTHGADIASANLEPEYIVDDGDVLFSWSGSLECVLWAGGRGALNQHLFKVTSNEYPKWFVYLWIHHHLEDFRHIAAGKATTMGHIQRHHLRDAVVIIPTEPIMKDLDRTLNPIVERVIQCRVESRTLAQLRDTLLPKLLTGEIRVGAAEKKVAEVV